MYLPLRLKRELGRMARQRKVSEAALLREAIARLAEEEAPAPRLPLFRAKGRSIAEDVERELAKGFGRR